MRIAVLGTRGIPANYGGFETCAEQLSHRWASDLEGRVEVTKVGSDYFKGEYFAPRPASEKLVNMKLHARGFRHMPHWRDALAEYAREFKAALPKS